MYLKFINILVFFSIFYLTGEVQLKSSWTIFLILILSENIMVYLGDLWMSAQKFENFQLSIEIACLDCKDIEELSIRPRDFVNLEGDLTLEEK